MGYTGGGTSHGGPFSWCWSATSTDVFITYAARVADGPTNTTSGPTTAADTGGGWHTADTGGGWPNDTNTTNHWRQGWPPYQ